jgi:YfiR/HmsC-like
MHGRHCVSRLLFLKTALLGLIGVAVVHGVGIADVSISEDSVRAAYLYRFTGYVTWPQPPPPEAPLIIDVLGSPAIARELRRMLPAHTSGSRAAQIREVSSLEDLGNAQILYVGAGHAQLLREFRPQGAAAMLLVTAEPDGLDSGSVINFVTVDRNVRFEVSLPAAQRWGLKVSADLLGVAVRVQGGHAQ